MRAPDLAIIAVGDILPAKVHTPTTAQLVRYAGAARDYSGIHYDTGYARQRGFPDVIVHGFLKAGFLAELGRDWGGHDSWYRRFSARYQGIDVVGSPIVCRGEIVSVDVALAQVELKLWTENAAGKTTTTATGVLEIGVPV